MEIIFSGFFCASLVFAMLGILYVLLKLSSGIIRFLEKKRGKK